jgi:DNA-directed RNA polymerase subunit RPC12/RpoP
MSIEKKGHGKNGVSVYKRAERKQFFHPRLQAGSKCPECHAGRLFKLRTPAVLLRLKGQAPIAATIYELERLRCSSCGAIFKAPVPQEA